MRTAKQRAKLAKLRLAIRTAQVQLSATELLLAKARLAYAKYLAELDG